MEGRSRKTETEGSHPERKAVPASIFRCGRCRFLAVFLFPEG